MERVERIVESLLLEATAGTVEVFLTILKHRITKYDQAASSKPGFNSYALPQYFGAIQDRIEPKVQKYLHRDDPEAINAFLGAMGNAFTRHGRIGQEGDFILRAAREVEKMAINWRDNHVLPKL
jgi:hypothetical protein